MCRNPFIRDPSGKLLRLGPNGDFSERQMGLPVPCGQCLHCRINKRRVWTLRLMMELRQHEKASFVTLTYDSEHVPVVDGVQSLSKRDFQLWLKRIRKLFDLREGRKIRFYACGEYGTRSRRPHYHAILFGVSPEELDSEWFLWNGQSGPATNVRPARLDTVLYRTWCRGIVHVGEVSRKSIQYVAGYITKKMTSDDDSFALMSRKPGIGSDAADAIVATLKKANISDVNVGKELRIDGNKWPIGRYLSLRIEKLRGELFDSSKYIDSVYSLLVESQESEKPFVDYLVSLDDDKYSILEAKQKIFNQRDKI